MDTNLGVKVSPTDFDIAHRIGQCKREGNMAVIVKFATRKCKYAAIYNRRKLKGSSVVISEDLTATNYIRLKKIKKTLLCHTGMGTRGKILAKREDGFIALAMSTVQISENIFNSVRGELSTKTPILMPGHRFN